MRVRAPGKLMVAGEYAVLHGGDAVVMAVDRHAVIADAAEPHPAPPREVAAALAIALREKDIDAINLRWSLDVARLGDARGRKLGLGSSAAACVAAVGWSLARAGADLGDVSVRARVADLARRGHREAQGGGSGVDVLASARGGVISVGFPEGLAGEATVRACGAFEGQCWAVLWSGSSARTSEMIARTELFRTRDPAGFAARMRDLATAAEAMREALEARDPVALTAATRRHGEAMRALGADAEAPIVTPALAELAAELGAMRAAVKPSGAGGGDVSLLVAEHDDALREALARAEARGFERVSLAVDREGVCGDAG